MATAPHSPQEPPAHKRGKSLLQCIACFALGCFAGALASFFPRLMAILAGDPTQKVELFSTEYLIVGGIVAAIVGLVIMIVDGGPDRTARDVFMTALGLPTLLMGALTTGATSSNIAKLQSDLTRASAALQSSSDVPTRPAGVSVPIIGPISLLPSLDLLIGTAHAQTTSAARPPQSTQSRLGIVSRQLSYYVVLGSAASESDLLGIQRAMSGKGISTRIVKGSHGDALLIPGDGAVKPYSAAVLAAVQAREAGARPYLVQIDAE